MSRCHAGYCCSNHSVPARLAHFTSNFPRALSGMARTRFPRRSGNCLAGDRFAARCFFRPAAFGAHGATSVADVRRSAAGSAGGALSSTLARAPKKIRARRSGPILNLAGAPPGWNHTHASAELLAHNGGNALCLARAGGVRSRAPLARLAQIRARLRSARQHQGQEGLDEGLSPWG